MIVSEGDPLHHPSPIPLLGCCALNVLPKPAGQEAWHTLSPALQADLQSHLQRTWCWYTTFWMCCGHINQAILIQFLSFLTLSEDAHVHFIPADTCACRHMCIQTQVYSKRDTHRCAHMCTQTPVSLQLSSNYEMIIVFAGSGWSAG